MRRHVLQPRDDRQVLGTDALALAAGDAVRRLAKPRRQVFVVGEVDRPALLRQVLAHVLVVQREVLRNGDLHRAALGAVGTARAGDGDLAVDDPGGLLHQGDLVPGQRHKIRHVAQVVLHLRHIAHAGEDHHHVLQAGGEANRPGRQGCLRVRGLQQRLGLRGQLCQGAALDRLHDHHRLSVLDRRLIAGPGLYPLALPVQVVDLELHEFHLRVLREDLVQQLGGAVEGEAGVLHQSLGLLVQQPAEAVELLVFGIAAGFDAVEQVVVEVARPGLLQLVVEDPVPVLQGIEKAAVQLRGQREAVPGVAVHQRRLCDPLAGEAVVHDGGVEVGEALFDEPVDHLLDLLDVHGGVVVRVGQRHAHQAESKLFHGLSSCCSVSLFGAFLDSVSFSAQALSAALTIQPSGVFGGMGTTGNMWWRMMSSSVGLRS